MQKENSRSKKILSSKNSLSLSAYCDANWAACPLTRRSLTGYVIMLGDYIVSWKMKKQPTVSRSSAEAEYRAMAMTYSELKWTIELLESLGIHRHDPVPFHCDNKAALHIAANPVFHERTKHIEIDCHFIRDAVLDGIIATQHIDTIEQLADIFTKLLGQQHMRYLFDKMDVRDLHVPS